MDGNINDLVEMCPGVAIRVRGAVAVGYTSEADALLSDGTIRGGGAVVGNHEWTNQIYVDLAPSSPSRCPVELLRYNNTIQSVSKPGHHDHLHVDEMSAHERGAAEGKAGSCVGHPHGSIYRGVGTAITMIKVDHERFWGRLAPAWQSDGPSSKRLTTQLCEVISS